MTFGEVLGLCFAVSFLVTIIVLALRDAYGWLRRKVYPDA